MTNDMTFTDIIKDTGFRIFVLDILKIDKMWSNKFKKERVCNTMTYEILHKTREAINKDTGIQKVIELINGSVIIKTYVNDFSDWEKTNYHHINYNRQEIESLAAALFFIYKESKDGSK